MAPTKPLSSSAMLLSKPHHAFALYFIKELTEGLLAVFAAIAAADLLIGALQFSAKRGEFAGLLLAELSIDVHDFFTFPLIPLHLSLSFPNVPSPLSRSHL